MYTNYARKLQGLPAAARDVFLGCNLPLEHRGPVSLLYAPPFGSVPGHSAPTLLLGAGSRLDALGDSHFFKPINARAGLRAAGPVVAEGDVDVGGVLRVRGRPIEPNGEARPRVPYTWWMESSDKYYIHHSAGTQTFTDAAAAFDWLKSRLASGQTLYITGVWPVSTSWAWPYYLSDFTILGDGATSELRSVGTAVPLSIVGWARALIQGLKLNGNRASGGQASHLAWVNNSAGVIFRAIEVINSYARGIQIGSNQSFSFDSIIEDSEFYNNYSSSITLWGANASNVVVRGNTFYGNGVGKGDRSGNSINAIGDVFTWGFGRGLAVVGNLFSNFAGGATWTDFNLAPVHIRSTMSALVSGNAILGCCNQGILALGTSASGALSIAGNLIEACLGQGMYIEGYSGSAITGNVVRGNGGGGILLGSYDGERSDNSTVVGNTVENNGSIGIASDSHACTIIGNNVRNNNAQPHWRGIVADRYNSAGYTYIKARVYYLAIDNAHEWNFHPGLAEVYLTWSESGTPKAQTRMEITEVGRWGTTDDGYVIMRKPIGAELPQTGANCGLTEHHRLAEVLGGGKSNVIRLNTIVTSPGVPSTPDRGEYHVSDRWRYSNNPNRPELKGDNTQLEGNVYALSTGEISPQLLLEGYADESPSVPAGTVRLWCLARNKIPRGWAEMNGVDNATSKGGSGIDMTGRYLRGALSSESPGQTGGTSTHSHNLPSSTIYYSPGSTPLSYAPPTTTDSSAHDPVRTALIFIEKLAKV